MEDDQNGRQPGWKTIWIEENQNGRQPKWKMTKIKDDLTKATQCNWKSN